MIKERPDNITLCELRVILMPNGEVICLGKTLGWFKDLSKYLTKVDEKKGGTK